MLPFSARTYPRRGSFTLLDFDDDEDPSVVYVEVPKGARYFDQPSDRSGYEHVFEARSCGSPEPSSPDGAERGEFDHLI